MLRGFGDPRLGTEGWCPGREVTSCHMYRFGGDRCLQIVTPGGCGDSAARSWDTMLCLGMPPTQIFALLKYAEGAHLGQKRGPSLAGSHTWPGTAVTYFTLVKTPQILPLLLLSFGSCASRRICRFHPSLRRPPGNRNLGVSAVISPTWAVLQPHGTVQFYQEDLC